MLYSTEDDGMAWVDVGIVEGGVTTFFVVVVGD